MFSEKPIVGEKNMHNDLCWHWGYWLVATVITCQDFLSVKCFATPYGQHQGHSKWQFFYGEWRREQLGLFFLLGLPWHSLFLKKLSLAFCRSMAARFCHLCHDHFLCHCNNHCSGDYIKQRDIPTTIFYFSWLPSKK